MNEVTKDSSALNDDTDLRLDFSELETLLRDSESEEKAGPGTFEPGRKRTAKDGGGTHGWGLLFAGWLLMALGLLMAALAVHGWYLSDRLLWHIRIAGSDIGGKTLAEARAGCIECVRRFQSEPVTILSSEGQYRVSEAAFGTTFDVDDGLFRAYRAGRMGNFLHNQIVRIRSLFEPTPISLHYWFDEDRLTEVVTNQVPNLRERLPVDASVIRSGTRFVVVPGRDGLGFNADRLSEQYHGILSEMKTGDLVVDIDVKSADIDVEMAETARRLASRIIHRILIMEYSYDGYNYDTWTIPLAEVKSWVEFKKIKEWENYALYPSLNEEKLRHHLNWRIAKYLYLPKEDITIESEHGKPVIKGTAKDGYYLDVARSVTAINDTLRFDNTDTTGNYRVRLEVAHLTGGVANPDNEFGISDVLATGVTDFFGSPQNRKFNINHVAERFQNIILQPGDKFSFIRYMGKVDSANGFVKELIIVNGDSAEPQYGGGICQVSSTLFRTIFFAGLPVLNRANHSFEVKYYRPVGLDATVFDPAPDLKFENDTKYPVLVQNFVDLKRTKLYFKLLGKKDGRKVHYEGPIYDGLVGEKKEHYRYSWVRYVEYPEGNLKRSRFVSVYRNKDLVKHYVPDSLLVLPDSLLVLRDSLVVLPDSLLAHKDSLRVPMLADTSNMPGTPPPADVPN